MRHNSEDVEVTIEQEALNVLKAMREDEQQERKREEDQQGISLVECFEDLVGRQPRDAERGREAAAKPGIAGQLVRPIPFKNL